MEVDGGGWQKTTGREKWINSSRGLVTIPYNLRSFASSLKQNRFNKVELFYSFRENVINIGQQRTVRSMGTLW